ncbi:DEAD/DEAH box helicase [Bacteriovorax sp. BSW11_IV]|uniref:DEAD/DEAH box helicase n=1 Tax=Bacteriovorax sp. BSW11_IV TaxID=1353529 RepID=UPI00038A2D66|nr:DEAD/DEAH box helicase [Bacteriovorax sp. BSW11_IV]EQC45885.1 DEAD/DEAH box helicase [Bacteriovorax sp. BSW11_IV]
MDNSNIFTSLTLIPSSFTLMIAPTGWGKTTLVLELAKVQKIVFISPLRIIAQEFEQRAARTHNIFSTCHTSTPEVLSRFLKAKRGILITTAEKIYDYLECFNDKSILFVLDEIHLFWHWGKDFRPVLKEVLMGVCGQGFKLLGLSATIDKSIIDKELPLYGAEYEHSYLIDLTQTQKSRPTNRILGMKNVPKNIFHNLVLNEALKNKENTLLFVKSRKEVDFYCDFYAKKGLQVLGCKGGEVYKFYLELIKKSGPMLIVSTTALSHGANLPVIRKVFINYEVTENDFFVQMKGRGGRDGGGFDFFHCNEFDLSFKESLKIGLISVLLKGRFIWQKYEDKSRRDSLIENSLSRKTRYWKSSAKKWQKYFCSFLWWSRWGS